MKDFLNKKHGDNFLVFNMSGRDYDISKLDNKVESFQWEDHHSPALHILFEACCKMHLFLKCKIYWSYHFFCIERQENVVVIHCNAGKGRTGTLISCYLMYCGLAENA